MVEQQAAGWHRATPAEPATSFARAGRLAYTRRMPRWVWRLLALSALPACRAPDAQIAPPWEESPPAMSETARAPALAATPTPMPTVVEPPRATGTPPYVVSEDGIGVTHADEAEVERRLPIVVRSAVGGVARIVVRYKAVGADRWSALRLDAKDGVFTGEVPCDAMMVSGDFKYYVLAMDATGSLIATVGAMTEPLRTVLTSSTSPTLWTLPGRPASPKCAPASESELRDP